VRAVSWLGLMSIAFAIQGEPPSSEAIGFIVFVFCFTAFMDLTEWAKRMAK